MFSAVGRRGVALVAKSFSRSPEGIDYTVRESVRCSSIEEEGAYEVGEVLPRAGLECIDEFRIEFIIGEPRSSRQFDRGIDRREHVDLSRGVLRVKQSAQVKFDRKWEITLTDLTTLICFFPSRALMTRVMIVACNPVFVLSVLVQIPDPRINISSDSSKF